MLNFKIIITQEGDTRFWALCTVFPKQQQHQWPQVGVPAQLLVDCRTDNTTLEQSRFSGWLVWKKDEQTNLAGNRLPEGELDKNVTGIVKGAFRARWWPEDEPPWTKLENWCASASETFSKFHISSEVNMGSETGKWEKTGGLERDHGSVNRGRNCDGGTQVDEVCPDSASWKRPRHLVQEPPKPLQWELQGLPCQWEGRGWRQQLVPQQVKDKIWQACLSHCILDSRKGGRICYPTRNSRFF